MATEIKNVTPGAFTPSRRSRRQDDENGGGDFARWMSGAGNANDDKHEAPKRPLTQTPMTSLEDMLLLAHAREQIANAQANSAPIAAYAQAETIEALDYDENQYAFEFISYETAGAKLDERI